MIAIVLRLTAVDCCFQGYIAYDNAPAIPKHSIFQNPNLTYGIVQELSEDYTDVTDNYVITDLANIEAWDMIYRDGWWYLIVSTHLEVENKKKKESAN